MLLEGFKTINLIYHFHFIIQTTQSKFFIIIGSNNFGFSVELILHKGNKFQ